MVLADYLQNKVLQYVASVMYAGINYEENTNSSDKFTKALGDFLLLSLCGCWLNHILINI